MQNHKLLDVNNLSISFSSEGIDKDIIHNISYHLNTNEILSDSNSINEAKMYTFIKKTNN